MKTIKQHIIERLILSKTKVNNLYDTLFDKLKQFSPSGNNDVYFERVYNDTQIVLINNIEYDLESIGWNKGDNCIELCTYPSRGETRLHFWYITNDEDLLKYLGGDFEDNEFMEECVKNIINYINIRLKTKQ